MTREELIEIVAHKLSWLAGAGDVNPYRSEARDILSAIESSGLAIVPVEPTAKMISAFDDWNWSPECAGCIDTWDAMIKANPLKPHD